MSAKETSHRGWPTGIHSRITRNGQKGEVAQTPVSRRADEQHVVYQLGPKREEVLSPPKKPVTGGGSEQAELRGEDQSGRPRDRETSALL